MVITRREMLERLGKAAGAAALLPAVAVGDGGSGKRLGLTVASYGFRYRLGEAVGSYAPFENALGLLEHCHELGAGGIQVGVAGWEREFAGKLRERREGYGMYLEGQVRLPDNKGDVPRFRREIQLAKEAGATVLRTVALSGRRYERFESAEAFRQFRKQAVERLGLAEPVVRRERVKLAIENHKDWLVPELLRILERFSSEYVGVCIDTGNSISLLETPMEFVRAYAPFVMTTHFKDMAVEEYEEGFLLSEVPLGEGFLDLKAIMNVCERANPGVQFNLEMITRDPLQVPCLSAKYWSTLADVPGWHLAKTLRMVREHPPAEALPSVAHRDAEGRLAFEEENVRRSFRYAKEQLGL